MNTLNSILNMLILMMMFDVEVALDNRHRLPGGVNVSHSKRRLGCPCSGPVYLLIPGILDLVLFLQCHKTNIGLAFFFLFAFS